MLDVHLLALIQFTAVEKTGAVITFAVLAAQFVQFLCGESELVVIVIIVAAEDDEEAVADKPRPLAFVVDVIVEAEVRNFAWITILLYPFTDIAHDVDVIAERNADKSIRNNDHLALMDFKLGYNR